MHVGLPVGLRAMGPPLSVPPQKTIVWGLKRSGIHLLVGWLYANHGASERIALQVDGLHPQLCDGFRDPVAGVAFFNNCGRMYSRRFELGDLAATDFERAAEGQRQTIFEIEDCSLSFSSRTAGLASSVNVLVLRDPLNNLASRLAAAVAKPKPFRVDGDYLDLVESYCAEFLGHTAHLEPKVLVSYNRFLSDRAYRDEVAAALGLENVDVVTEVSDYGGGSSFTAGELSTEADLMSRHRQHAIPQAILDDLRARPVVREACATVFGYDLDAEAGT